MPETPASIRVALADDHAMGRRTLRLMLDGEQDVEVIAETTDLSAVLGQVGRHIPHVLELDPRIPNGSSIETRVWKLPACSTSRAGRSRPIESRIYNKLGFRTRAELVQFALLRRLIGG